MTQAQGNIRPHLLLLAVVATPYVLEQKAKGLIPSRDQAPTIQAKNHTHLKFQLAKTHVHTNVGLSHQVQALEATTQREIVERRLTGALLAKNGTHEREKLMIQDLYTIFLVLSQA